MKNNPLLMDAPAVLRARKFGAGQDIEGAFVNGRFYVVQSRPQVGLQNEETRPD